MNSFYIAWNMVKRTLGSKKGFMAFLLIPSLVVSAAIGFIGREEGRVNILVVNEDQGSFGGHVLREMAARPEYTIEVLDNAGELKEAIIEKRGQAGFVLPAGFSRELLEGGSPVIQTYELNVNEATAVMNVRLNEITGRMVSAAAAAKASTGSAEDRDTALANILAEAGKHTVSAETGDLKLAPKPGLNNITGFTLMFLMSLVLSTVSLVIEDRAKMTMARMYTAPVKAAEIAAGNFLGSFVVGSLQILFVLVMTRLVIGYDYGVPFLSQFVVLAAFMLVSLGLASTVAGIIKNPGNASMINSMVVTPTSMLGGCFWPISIMPDYLQKLSNFMPQTWTIQAIEKMAAGASLTDVRLPLAILALMAVVLLAVGSAILRPSENKVRM
ncbi:ABC transporter permease [Paenibacillus sp. 1P03SA]|uniref:ABC transporter permease n=1 Tax=Paenibacillus sp. 1P03SA TaxID=3132294 RepID=UPI0039A0F430